jgi:hypothetical protein
MKSWNRGFLLLKEPTVEVEARDSSSPIFEISGVFV